MEYPVTRITPSKSMADVSSIEIFVCGKGTGKNDSTCQECFTRELFGDTNGGTDRKTESGDTLILYDYGDNNTPNDNDKFIFGPFTAETDIRKNIEPDAWDGGYPNQVRVSWDQLYRLPADEAPVEVWQQNNIYQRVAQNLIETIEKKGQKVRVADNGDVEPIEDPADDESDDEEHEDDAEDEDAEDEAEGLRDIMELRDLADPVPKAKEIEQAQNPGTAILRPAISGELRPDIYADALTHLVAGKNVIFYGPPGSGKTRIAERLTKAVCTSYEIATANAEWTNQDVVGGYQPDEKGFSPTPGVFSQAAADCLASLTETNTPQPTWLIIDELNRANLDEAFGEVFTLLDLSYRTETKLTYANDETQRVPLAFRVLGTMNSEDQAQLFALGYAFRRRFAFVEVPPLHENSDYAVPDAEPDTISINEEFAQIEYVLRQAVKDDFEQMSSVANDTPFALPYLETVISGEEDLADTIDAQYETTQSKLTPPNSSLTFDQAIRWFVQQLDERDIVSVGQGIIIDAYKYVIVYDMLFPSSVDWSAVDRAVASYILPQVEPFMTELRRADTVGTESDAKAQFRNLIGDAEAAGLVQTAAILEEAQETREIIG